MPEIDLSSDVAILSRELNVAVARLSDEIYKATEDSTDLVWRRSTQFYLRGGTTRTRLAWRSGKLAGSVTRKVYREQEGPLGVVGTNKVYGKTHELGPTVIRPKKAGGALTIPFPHNALTPAGRPKFTAREIIENPGRGGFTGTFIAKSVIFGVRAKGRGTGITGSRENIVPLFVLKKRVKVPARPFLSTALLDEESAILDLYAKAAERSGF